MAYKQEPGRSPLEKTGRDIPLNMKSPAYMTDPDPKKGKAKVGEIPGQEEIQERFKGKYKVVPIKGKKNQYSLIDKSGHSVSYSPGRKVKDKSMTVPQAINKQVEDDKKGK
jgi:hypothetical protein